MSQIDESPNLPASPVPPKWNEIFRPGLLVSLAGAVAAFSWPLYQLFRFSIGNELYSHIVLIPFISIYLVYQDRQRISAGGGAPLRGLAVVLWLVGLLLVGIQVFASPTQGRAPQEDPLVLTTLAFLLILAGTCAFNLDRSTLGALAFPIGFLIFMVPFPTAVLESVESFLQYGSAAMAHFLFSLTGTTVFVDGLVFQLPGITLQVAPECSGIHSSLALLITSVLAGRFFLRSSGRRVALACAVIPLALLRNGFRIFVIGELCVHIGPEMIDSYIHRHGGPIFFAASLLPFFLFLIWLVRGERRAAIKLSIRQS